MLNKCSESLAISLSVIFRTFYNKRCFPTFWKKSEITPIFKSTDQSLVNKYRPMSLLCYISKVWEKKIEKTIAEIFLPKVDPCQYGFVPKRSTLLQLLAYTDEIYRTLDSPKNSLQPCTSTLPKLLTSWTINASWKLYTQLEFQISQLTLGEVIWTIECNV